MKLSQAALEVNENVQDVGPKVTDQPITGGFPTAPLDPALQGALDAIKRGWKVFPIARGFKDKPLTAWVHGGHGQKASSDPQQVAKWSQQWPGSNWGLATGAVSGVWVADTDNPCSYKYAVEKGLTNTRCVKSGSVTKKMAFHFYQYQPMGLKVKCSTSELEEGLDIKGDGGMVLLPGSIHPDGPRYELVDDREPAEAPPEIVELVRKPKEEPPVDLSDLAPLTEHQILLGFEKFERARRRYANVTEGEWNTRLSKLTYVTGKLIARGVMTEDQAWEMMCAIPTFATYLQEKPRVVKDNFKRGIARGLAKPWDPIPDEERQQAKLVEIFGDPRIRPTLPAGCIPIAEYEARRASTVTAGPQLAPLVSIAHAAPVKQQFSLRDIKDPRSYTFPPQRWIIPGWLCEGMYTLIVAGYGQGKSNLSMAICRAIAEGRPFLGFEVEQRPVVYIDRENPWESIKARFDWLGMKLNNPQMIYFGRHVPGEEVPGPDAQCLLDFVREEPVKPVIVFDSLVRFLPTGNDSSVQETTEFARQILKLRDAGAAIVVLHHSGKGESTLEGRGSTDITAACDFKLQMEASRLEGLKLRQIKVWQPRARLHAENGVQTGPEQHILIDIAGDGAFTINGTETARSVRVAKVPAEDIEKHLRALLRDNPGARGCDLEEWAKTYFISRKQVREWLKVNTKNGAVIDEAGEKNVKKYTWVGPALMPNFPRGI